MASPIEFNPKYSTRFKRGLDLHVTYDQKDRALSEYHHEDSCPGDANHITSDNQEGGCAYRVHDLGEATTKCLRCQADFDFDVNKERAKRSLNCVVQRLTSQLKKGFANNLETEYYKFLTQYGIEGLVIGFFAYRNSGNRSVSKETFDEYRNAILDRHREAERRLAGFRNLITWHRKDTPRFIENIFSGIRKAYPLISMDVELRMVKLNHERGELMRLIDNTFDKYDRLTKNVDEKFQQGCTDFHVKTLLETNSKVFKENIEDLIDGSKRYYNHLPPIYLAIESYVECMGYYNHIDTDFDPKDFVDRMLTVTAPPMYKREGSSVIRFVEKTMKDQMKVWSSNR